MPENLTNSFTQSHIPRKYMQTPQQIVKNLVKNIFLLQFQEMKQQEILPIQSKETVR